MKIKYSKMGDIIIVVHVVIIYCQNSNYYSVYIIKVGGTVCQIFRLDWHFCLSIESFLRTWDRQTHCLIIVKV